MATTLGPNLPSAQVTVQLVNASYADVQALVADIQAILNANLGAFTQATTSFSYLNNSSTTTSGTK